MSDLDLIFLIKAGSKLAERTMFMRYSRHASKVAKRYADEFSDTGISCEEFYAIAFSKTYDALFNYVESEEVPFYAYWRSSVKNAIYDYVRDNSYTLGAKAFGGISLDSTRYDDNEMFLFHDVFGEEESTNQTINTIREYVYGNSKELTDEEKLLAHYLYFEELSPQEIMEAMHLGRNRVSYLTRTLKEKFQRLLKENYL